MAVMQDTMVAVAAVYLQVLLSVEVCVVTINRLRGLVVWQSHRIQWLLKQPFAWIPYTLYEYHYVPTSILP